MLLIDLDKVKLVAEFADLYRIGGAIYFAYIEAMELPDSPYVHKYPNRIERKKEVIRGMEQIRKRIHSSFIQHTNIDESVVEGEEYRKAVAKYKELFDIDEDEITLDMLRTSKDFTLKQIKMIQTGFIPYGIMLDADNGDFDDEGDDKKGEVLKPREYKPIAWLKEATDFINLLDKQIADVSEKIKDKKNRRNAEGIGKDNSVMRYSFKNTA